MEPREQESSEEGIKERWSYERFRQYLLLFSRLGESAIETAVNYPTTIILNTTWHQTLNEIREAVKDGKERWTMLGVKAERTDLFIPLNPVVGLAYSVPEELAIGKYQAIINNGIDTIVGDFHSHPDRLIDRSDRWVNQLGRHRLKAFFSRADYFGFLLPTDPRLFRAVTDGDYNLFAFKTHNTKDSYQQKELSTLNAFMKAWFITAALKGAGYLNVEIAMKFNLILYQGRANEDLVRIHS